MTSCHQLASPRAGPANFSSARIVNIFSSWAHTMANVATVLCLSSLGHHVGDRGCVPIKLYFWIQQFAFHIIFMSQNIIILFCSTLYKHKNHPYLVSFTESDSRPDPAQRAIVHDPTAEQSPQWPLLANLRSHTARCLPPPDT